MLCVPVQYAGKRRRCGAGEAAPETLQLGRPGWERRADASFEPQAAAAQPGGGASCCVVLLLTRVRSFSLLQYFAKIGGISLGEMNALEVEMLQRIDYRLHVHPEEFDAVCERLAGHLSQEELEAAEASWVTSPAEAAGEQARVAA